LDKRRPREFDLQRSDKQLRLDLPLKLIFVGPNAAFQIEYPLAMQTQFQA